MNNKTIFLLLSLFVFLSINVNAATYTVTKISDTKSKSIAETLADKSDCELREAVRAANSTPEDDVIEFDPNVFGEKQTIVLDGTLRFEGDTKGSLTINGNGVTITAPSARVIDVTSGQILTLTGITVAGGTANLAAGIANFGRLTLINCTVRDNVADFGGGGIYNGSTLFLFNSTVTRNQAVNPSFGEGGGIMNAGLATLINSTITGNSAITGGGIFGDNPSGYQTIAKNTIVAGNTATSAPDCLGVIDSQGYNLIGDTNGTSIIGDTTGNILNQNAFLGPLQNNGGPTLTHAPLANSPAIDAGNNSLATGSTDQRGTGFPRVLHRRVDIGAIEYRNPNPTNEILVDNTSDNGSLSACTAAANDCSLRGAISSSVSGSINAISFDANVFSVPQTITLTNGELLILGTGIDIEIRGRNGLTISGNNASRVFNVNQATFTLYDVIVSNGRTGFGGGIFNQDGKLTINNSTISNNSTNAGGSGGGIYNDSGTVDIYNSTFSGNQANPDATNSGGFGGAIYNYLGTTKLTNSTVAFNTGLISGGIFNQTGTVLSSNSIIANNFAAIAFDFGGTLTSQGYNLIGNTNNTTITGTTTGNILNAAANLSPFGNNGGNTPTFALLAGSPALNAGSNALALDENNRPMTNDQRGAGFFRVRSATVDIGAVESSIVRDFTVDNTTDNGSLSACTNAANDCSLRGAIAAVNLGGFTSVISFDPIVFASWQTITLTNGFISIADNTSVKINGINGLRISGNSASRIFLIAQTGGLSLNNLTLTNGFQGGDGGAVFSQGFLDLTNTTVAGNRATERGGGIFNFGGTVNLTNSTISSNSLNAVSQGGGIYNLSGTVNFTNSTIAYNTAQNGGGILNDAGTVNSLNSMIANNFGTAGFDVFGTLSSQGYNLIGNTTNTTINGDTTGNILNVFAGIAPLGYYGGQNMTHALLANSPAINTGNSASSPANDQRGAARIGTADIGSFESNGIVAPLPDGKTGFYYGFTIAPNNSSFTYSVTSGNLPNGLSLSSSFAPSAVVAISGAPTQAGMFNFAITASDGVSSNITNYSLFIELGPTASNATVSGRVFSPFGRGLANAYVVMTNQNGESVRTRTNQLGYYRFAEVQSGETYIFNVQSKRYQFTPQVVNVSENLEGLNFYP